MLHYQHNQNPRQLHRQQHRNATEGNGRIIFRVASLNMERVPERTAASSAEGMTVHVQVSQLVMVKWVVLSRQLLMDQCISSVISVDTEHVSQIKIECMIKTTHWQMHASKLGTDILSWSESEAILDILVGSYNNNWNIGQLPRVGF